MLPMIICRGPPGSPIAPRPRASAAHAPVAVARVNARPATAGRARSDGHAAPQAWNWLAHNAAAHVRRDLPAPLY